MIVTKNLPVVDPGHVNVAALKKIFERMSGTRVDSIIADCGFDKDIPIRMQQPAVHPERKSLDDLIFDAIGLTQAERNEVYWSVCELVQNRLKKAESV